MAESTEKKIRKFFEVGTIEGMILGVVLAIVVWLLLIWQGFWKTLLFAALVLLFLFIFGVKDKQGFLRRVSRTVAPQGGAAVNHEALTQKVRETVKQPESAVEAFADDVEEAAEDAEEAVKETEEAVKEAEEEAADDAAEAVEEAADSVEEAVEAIDDAAEELKKD